VKTLSTPLATDQVRKLRAGELVLVSGTVYTARDAAHARIVAALARGEEPPFALAGQVIYYVGPCPAAPGKVIGSCGPTTSGRMDAYAPLLIEKGIKAMIGKGERSPEVVEAMRKHGAVYLATVGGAGAYLAGCVKQAHVIAYPDLGPEAVLRLEVEKMPCVVAIDSTGANLYRTGRQKYRVP